MSSKPKHTEAPGNKSGRVYFIDASGGRLLSVNPDGSDLKVLVTDRHRIPDGIVVDLENGHIYWTEMGIPNKEDGSIGKSKLCQENQAGQGCQKIANMQLCHSICQHTKI